MLKYKPVYKENKIMFTPKAHLDSQNNMEKSVRLLDWFSSFKNNQLVSLAQYAKSCNKKERHSIDELINECSIVENELQLVLNKNVWESLSLESWNAINKGINNKLENIANQYEELLPQLESFEKSM